MQLFAVTTYNPVFFGPCIESIAIYDECKHTRTLLRNHVQLSFQKLLFLTAWETEGPSLCRLVWSWLAGDQLTSHTFTGAQRYSETVRIEFAFSRAASVKRTDRQTDRKPLTKALLIDFSIFRMLLISVFSERGIHFRRPETEEPADRSWAPSPRSQEWWLGCPSTS